MTIPQPLYDDLRKLNAPEAKKLREKHGIGTSGAKITIAEAEQLYFRVDTGILRADIHEGVQATRLDGLRVDHEMAQRKARAKRKKKR
jgi:hypothetical protein